MTKEDLTKAKIGKGLIYHIHKLEKQIEMLESCNGVKLFKTKDYRSEDVVFTIINGNPFYSECEILIDKYRAFLKNELDKAEAEFDRL